MGSGEHTRPACRGGRPRPPLGIHPAQPHFSSSASGLRLGSRQDHSGPYRIPPHAVLMVFRRSDQGPTVAAPELESRFADRGQVFRAARKTTRGGACAPHPFAARMDSLRSSLQGCFFVSVCLRCVAAFAGAAAMATWESFNRYHRSCAR